jgi:hypothetical protein
MPNKVVLHYWLSVALFQTCFAATLYDRESRLMRHELKKGQAVQFTASGSFVASLEHFAKGQSADSQVTPEFNYTTTSSVCTDADKMNIPIGGHDGITFRCKTDRCVPMKAMCNGFANCADKSDEEGCVVHGASPVESCDPATSEGCCRFDFPRGDPDTNMCDSRSVTQYSDMTESMCIWAAEQAGAITEPAHMQVPLDWESRRPKGCFMFKCLDSDNWCYYWNGDGAMPDGNLSGTPVCHRPRYIFGTSHPGKNITAPELCANDDYAVIADENECRLAASCLGDCAGGNFLIGVKNASTQMLFPPGCFLHKNDTSDLPCVHFNPDTLKMPPTLPEGSPICRVKHPERIPNATGSS